MAEFNLNEVEDNRSKYYYLKFFNSEEFKEFCECCNISISRDSNGNIILNGTKNDIENAKEQAANFVKEAAESKNKIEPFVDTIDENGTILDIPKSERKLLKDYGAIGEYLNVSNHDFQRTSPLNLIDLIDEKSRDMEMDIFKENERKRILKAKEEAEKKAKLKLILEKLPPEKREAFLQRKNLEESLLAAQEEARRIEQEEKDEYDPRDRRTWY